MSPGKAFAVIAKRTGGPAGMAVSAVWKGRDTLAKILIVIIALLLLPVMFILMLPSLIFGNEGLDAVPDNVLNDNSVIMANISQTETSIETILREKHNLLLDRILAEAANLGTNCEYSITDDFSDQIIYESALIISLSAGFQGSAVKETGADSAGRNRRHFYLFCQYYGARRDH